jgi:adenylate cyclase
MGAMMGGGGSATSGSDLSQPPLTAAAIRNQLARIIASPDFLASERLRAFLGYVVEETLAGRGPRIKAHSIAVEVFKRAGGLAPDDPIVRIEAGRLRRALERYYLVAGKSDPIVIEIPKGGYVPIFAEAVRSQIQSAPAAALSTQETPNGAAARRAPRWRFPAVLTAALAALIAAYWMGGRIETTFLAEGRLHEGATVIVAPFADLGDGADAGLYARGIWEELLDELPRFKELRVFGRETSEALPSRVDAAGVRRDLGARYLVSGGVRVSDGAIRVTSRLVETATGEVIWTETYNKDLRSPDLFAIQTDIAGQISRAVAQPGGVISRADASRPPKGPPDDLAAYLCTLSYYGYRAELSAVKHAPLRDCLERAVGRFPTFTTAWAMLSMAYIDEDRFAYNPRPGLPTALERALDASRRALQLDPDNIRGLQAHMLALFFNGRLDESLRVGEQALALNPNDSEVMGELGTRLAMSGQWRRGYDLLGQALLRNPGASGFYHAMRALAAYMLNDDQQALAEIGQSDLQKFPLFHSIAAMIYAQAGMMAEAKREGDQFLKMRPDFLSHIHAEARKRIVRPEDRARIIAGLAKAGLRVPLADLATDSPAGAPLQR